MTDAAWRAPCPDTGAPKARAVEITTCEHGHVFLHLVNAGGEVFAIAPFSPEGALAVAEALEGAARSCQPKATVN